MSRRFRTASVLVIALLIVAAFGLTAFAQTGSDTGDSGFTEVYQSFVSKLATNLGLDQDKVKSALDATQKQMLDEAVQQGKLTQEQADKMAAGGFRFCAPGYGKHVFGAPGPGGLRLGRDLSFNEVAAGFLGLTTDQLKEGLDTGKKLEQIVAEHGKTMEQLKQAIMDKHKEQINQDLTSGKITQEQADKMLQMIEKRSAGPFFRHK